MGNRGSAGTNLIARNRLENRLERAGMKRLISALLIVGGLLTLTGCNANLAAQVGDTKITQGTVQDRISEILAERRKFDTSQMQLSTGEVLNRNEVRFLLISTIFEKLAKNGGIEITQAMKDAKRAEIFGQLGGEQQLPMALVNAQIAPSDFDTYIQSVLISDALVAKAKAGGITDDQTGKALQQLVLALTKQESVKLNPQYGSWDPQNADLTSFDSAGTAVKLFN